jgi:oligopeptide/dipeptide ABC transporter ATP-binding protein
MYAGRVVERAPVQAIFDDPQHPYTLGLLGSMPRLEEQRDRLLVIEGSLPPPGRVPAGCRFHPRCVFATDACTRQDPPLRAIDAQHTAACIHAPVEQFAAQLSKEHAA